MSKGMELREPSCYNCSSRFLYEGKFPMKKSGIMMHPGERFCMFEKRPRRFKKQDPVLRVPAWCPKRLEQRKLRIYGFKSTDEWMLHDRLCRDLGLCISPEGHRYAVEQELDTELTAKEFLERSANETDAELLGGITLSRYQVLEIDDGLQPAFFYKTEYGYTCEPFFNAKAAVPLPVEKEKTKHKTSKNGGKSTC